MAQNLTSLTNAGQLEDFDLNTTTIISNGNYNFSITTNPTVNDKKVAVYGQLMAFTSTESKNVDLSNVRLMCGLGGGVNTVANTSKCYFVQYNGPETDLFSSFGGGPTFTNSELLELYYNSYITNDERDPRFITVGELDLGATYTKTVTGGLIGSVSLLNFVSDPPIEFNITTIKTTYLFVFVLDGTGSNPLFSVVAATTTSYDNKNSTLFENVDVDEYRLHQGFNTVGSFCLYYPNDIPGTYATIPAERATLFISLYGDVPEPPPLCFTGDAVCLTKNGNYTMVKNLNDGDYVYSSVNKEFVKIENIYVSETMDGLMVVPKNCINDNVPSYDLKITNDHIVKIGNESMPVKNLKNRHDVYEMEINEPVKIYTFVTSNGFYVDINNMNVKTFSKYERLIRFL